MQAYALHCKAVVLIILVTLTYVWIKTERLVDYTASNDDEQKVIGKT